MSTPSFAFTTLNENPSVITQQLPAGFNASVAWLLAQCCNLTYDQYDSGPNTLPDFSTLTTGTGNTITASNAVAFTVSEPAGPGSIPGDVGDYYLEAGGFGVVLTQSNPMPNTNKSFIVIALRGTRTWTEWLDDAEAVPLGFDGTFNGALQYGCVHAGILGYYTLGSDGATYGSNGWMSAANRPAGSLAAQIANYIGKLSTPLDVYVTGHSLGGALAAICAYDLALNFKTKISSLFMYNLASPRLAMGADVEGSSLFNIPVRTFLQNYQQNVPNSYRIVHSCDIVPILPPAALALGPIGVAAAHITDGWSVGVVRNPGLSANVVNFCAQSGDIGGNHACQFTYLPYTQWLATGSATQVQPSKRKVTAA